MFLLFIIKDETNFSYKVENISVLRGLMIRISRLETASCSVLQILFNLLFNQEPYFLSLHIEIKEH